MNIPFKRFTGSNTNSIYREIREKLGDDAEIISAGRIGNNEWEVIASDPKESFVVNRDPAQENNPKPSLTKDELAELVSETAEQVLEQQTHNPGDEFLKEISAEIPKIIDKNSSQDIITIHRAQSDETKEAQPAPTTTPNAPTEDIDELKEMVFELKQNLEKINTKMDWQSIGQDKNSIDLLVPLINAGFEQSIAKKIVASTPCEGYPKLEDIKNHLTTKLPIAKDDFLNEGGIVALIGPTGVGKTTTLVKLASKFAQKHGTSKVAIITTDTFKVAAKEQIKHYCKIMSIQSSVATTPANFKSAISRYEDKELILIDTAGMSQADIELGERLHTLMKSKRNIKNVLTLSAGTQFSTMQDFINKFEDLEFNSVILTKLDETMRLGQSLSCLMTNNLPLSYVTTGQNVPGDIMKASSKKLKDRVLESINEQSPNFDSELLELNSMFNED